ncbi:hypothetical protein ABID23_000773 [Bartonella silvatica]|uniref:Outer membrane lipoprotein n=1 Tax=Bartonella silvatica TaxID=357760 RepID=A0ABV2HHM0_9HYPH
MKHTYRILCLTIVALIVNACGFAHYGGQNVSTRIDGKWVDENGIISSFHEGIFETRAADTNEKLSEGTYSYVNTQYIEIEIRSILRGTISKVSCMISNNATHLLCTSHTGSQFFLKRKS